MILCSVCLDVRIQRTVHKMGILNAFFAAAASATAFLQSRRRC